MTEQFRAACATLVAKMVGEPFESERTPVPNGDVEALWSVQIVGKSTRKAYLSWMASQPPKVET